MDDYMFRHHVKNAKNVAEQTSYIEILNYSVGPVLPIDGLRRRYADSGMLWTGPFLQQCG
jgi:hypothetical protein